MRGKLALLIAVVGTAVATVFGAAAPIAAADACTVTVTVLGGQTYTFTVDTTPGTPISSLNLPIQGTVVSENESCPADASGSTSTGSTSTTTTTTAAPTSSTSTTTSTPTTSTTPTTPSSTSTSTSTSRSSTTTTRSSTSTGSSTTPKPSAPTRT